MYGELSKITKLDGFSDPTIQVNGCDNGILTKGYVIWFWFNEFKVLFYWAELNSVTHNMLNETIFGPGIGLSICYFCLIFFSCYGLWNIV